MTSLNTFLHNIKHQNKVGIGGIALSVIGLLAILAFATTQRQNITRTQASGSYISFEAENGTLTTPATTINDTLASAGKAVDLGAASSTPCSGVQVSPGQDIQGAINANPEGTTFCFQPGTYRLASPLNPKNNQSFIGAFGAVLSGAKVVTGFTQSGSNWVATGFLPSTPNTHGQCSVAGCTYQQDVFLSGEPLTRVTSLTSLAPGKFYEDFAANKIYLQDNPTGRIVEQAFSTALFDSAATGITIKGFVIEKAATESQFAAIQTRSNPANWTIEHNDIRFNHAGGIYANNGSIVRNNYIHHQGQTGIYGDYGVILVENNEVAFNNIAGYDFLWEAGGSKWSRTDGTIIRGNYFHDNNGPGIWTDILNDNVLIENNVVVRNKQNGIFHEISYGATIRNNISMDNVNICAFSYYCGSQILVSASSGVEVYGNTTRGWGGIGMLQQDRPESPDPRGPHIVQNVFIHDNNVHQTPVTAAAGAVTDTGDNSIFTNRNNRFANNHYHLGDLTGQYFYWLNDDHAKEQWQLFGMDTTGTYDTNVDNNAAPVPQLSVGPTNSGSNGAVTTTINLPTSGTYRVWSRINAPDQTNNSYTLRIDNNPAITVGDAAINAGSWIWVDYRDSNTNSKIDVVLTGGTHTLTLTGRESNVKIDRLILTTDTLCIPVDTGDNCTIADTPTPTPTQVIPTATPTPGTGTPVNAGYQTTNGAFDSGNNNGITSTQVVSGNAAGSLNSIKVYIGTVGAAPGNHMQVAIYADNGSNSPGALLGSSGSQVLTPNSWNTFNLSSISIAANTKYWLGFNVDSGSTQYGWSSQSSGLSAWKIPTAFGTWPNPFGSPSEPNGARSYAIYMTYTTAGGGNTPTPTIAVPTSTPIPTFTPSPTPTGDTIKPVVTITSPANGSQVPRKTSVTVQATASDNVGVTKVEFRRNGTLTCTDTSIPYSCSMSTDSGKNATVTYEARAYDANGNTGISTISVRTQ